VPATTAPPEATDPPKTVTPTDDPVRKPPPKLSQPTPMTTDTQLILIPQTGVDFSSTNQISGTWFFMFLGFTFLGFGMIFNGISNKRDRNE
jgi:hypothetical protein